MKKKREYAFAFVSNRRTAIIFKAILFSFFDQFYPERVSWQTPLKRIVVWPF